MDDTPKLDKLAPNEKAVTSREEEPEALTSTEWQRAAARRLFQKDLLGAIEAMWQAVTLDPLNFHHWMWLGNLYRQADDTEGSQWSAAQALRCLKEAPNPAISPEERARLWVRTSIHAGEPESAYRALVELEALRRTALDRCAAAKTFEEWYMADLTAAPIFETIVELYGVIGDSEKLRAAVQRYSDALERGLRLGSAEEVDAEELEILKTRQEQAWARIGEE